MDLITLLSQCAVCPVVPFDLSAPSVWVPDLTASNPVLHTLDLKDTTAFENWIFGEMRLRQTPVAIGGYAENRFLYHRSPHFSQQSQPRSLHLGIDIWADAGTPVMAPLAGRIHSFANNAAFGDYGHTLILEHQLQEYTFYSLYGHLSARSLEGLIPRQTLTCGETIAWLGIPAENGEWPPHLHFQLISDMQDRKGDFPGVAATEEKDFYLSLCPNPNLLLRSVHLPL
jgi:murein DD-endopeptidase MepM/ murein hydrolase activator NlpD